MKITPLFRGAAAIFLAWATLAFTTPQGLAAGKVSVADLSRMNGVWKAQSTNSAGEVQISYTVYRVQEDAGLQMVSSFTVDPKTKKVVSSFFGYVGVDPSTNQFTGLYFSDEGWVATSLMAPTARGRIYQVHVTLSNNVQTAATLVEEQESDTAMTMTWKNSLMAGVWREQSRPTSLVKLDQTLRELRESGAIVFPTQNEPIPALAPLKRLVGRWEAKEGGTTTHNLGWSWRGSGKWLVERWRIGQSQTGINVTGIHPGTGFITLWSIVAADRGEFGTWHVISENTLGQVQGQARLIREFSDDNNTFKAHWQVAKAGGFVDAPAETSGPPYTATRVARRE